MAGIGFLLKNLLDEDRYVSDFKANLYSVVLSSGPWIFAVLCIAALNVVAGFFIGNEGIMLFRVIIVYVFAFSLIFGSIFQLVMTRYISDKLFQKEYSSLLPNFAGAMTLIGIMNFVMSAAYMYFTHVSFLIKVLAVILYCTIGYQWMVMVFLGTVRDFIKVTIIFLGGFALSFLASMIIGMYLNVEGYLLGFTLGQVAALLLLLDRVVREFPSGKDKIYEFTRYFRKYPPLIWAGFFYNLGFWIDKIIYWYSPLGQDIARGSFRSQYPYDAAAFLATLTIMPALAIYFLHVETDFYEGLRRYINIILNKGIFDAIEKQRKRLIDLLQTELGDVFKVQFLVTLIIFLLSRNILNLIGYDRYIFFPSFVLCLAGSFFQVLFLTLIVLYWYLELLNESLLCVFVFFATNTLFNLYIIYIDPISPPGMGYMLSTMISVLLALLMLRNKLRYLNYYTFMHRPLKELQREMPEFS
jgi:polysaccharide biosynthesis protein PelG